MKKIISLMLTLIILLVPMNVFATSDDADFGKIIMGDVNNDGKVSAIDARTALRCAARLDSSDGVEMLSIDADGDNKITASDARAILRVSAKISHFTSGFDGEGNPCVLNTLRNKVYSVDVSNYDEDKDIAIDFVVACNNKNVYMMTEDTAMINELGVGGGLNIKKCGMMVADNKIYALLGTSSADVAMLIPKELQTELDMNADSLYEIIDMIDTLVPEDIGVPVATELNGEKVYCYTYSTVGQQCRLYITENGSIVRIDGYTGNGEFKTLLKFSDVSGDIPDKYFNLDNYELW